jgi:AraC family transcriptional regulator
LAKIAVKFGYAEEGGARPPRSRELVSGHGWAVSDVLCEAGPQNRPFEEQHSCTAVAIVVSGSFQYRSSTGREMMTPGSLLLGNAGDCFCCGHEHGTGDRCISFAFTQEFLDWVAEIAGSGRPYFHVPRIPPIRATAPLVARASAFLAGNRSVTGEELSVQVAVQASEIVRGLGPSNARADASALSRVTRVIRMIDNDPHVPHDLSGLADIARLSPHHFLRTFEGITGATPHQYVLRARLRRAAIRLKTETAKILDVALDCGFGDVSNFNRAFRAEFGMNPRRYRSTA